MTATQPDDYDDDSPRARMSRGNAHLANEPPEYFCGAPCPKRTRPDGTVPTCRARAGAGTEHVGYGCCEDHLGQTPSHNIAAKKYMVNQELTKLGLPSDSTDPVAVLLDAMQRADGMVRYIGDQLAVSGILESPDHLGDRRRVILEQQFDVWVSKQAQISAAMIKLGFEDRATRVTEAQLATSAAAVLAALDDPQWGLDHAQRRRGREAVARHLLTAGQVVEAVGSPAPAALAPGSAPAEPKSKRGRPPKPPAVDDGEDLLDDGRLI